MSTMWNPPHIYAKSAKLHPLRPRVMIGDPFVDALHTHLSVFLDILGVISRETCVLYVLLYP